MTSFSDRAKALANDPRVRGMYGSRWDADAHFAGISYNTGGYRDGKGQALGGEITKTNTCGEVLLPIGEETSSQRKSTVSGSFYKAVDII